MKIDRSRPMNNEPNKPAEELTEKELEGVVGGAASIAGLGLAMTG